MSRRAAPSEVPFAPLNEESGEATAFSCPLCGVRFAHGKLVCGTCPLHLGCDIVRCPHCGYQFPRSSRLIDWARRWFRRAMGANA